MTAYPIILRYRCPRRLLDATVHALGSEGHRESMAFWAGTVVDDTARFTKLLLPEGGGVDKEPYCSRVDSGALARVGARIDHPRELLLAQIHTHPGSPGHSWTDDTLSWRSPGFLSVVLPNYGRVTASSWRTWGFHRCDAASKYARLTGVQLREILHVLPEGEIEIHGPE